MLNAGVDVFSGKSSLFGSQKNGGFPLKTPLMYIQEFIGRGLFGGKESSSLNNESGIPNYIGRGNSIGHTSNTISVIINESKTPELTAKSVIDKLQSQLNDAYFQTPVFGVS